MPAAETILLVDDSDALRAVLCEMLEGAGYRVLPARNGLEALQISQTFPGRLDLVIADILMPLMDGLALAEKLRQKRPIRLLLMSGDPAALGRASAQPPRGTLVLQKPFTQDELLSTVREILAAGR